jgi:RHS repeat-associated protein
VFSTPRRNRWDGRGLTVATRDPLGVTTTTTYDAAGLFRIGLSDPFGESTFSYDTATGQMTSAAHADGSVTRFAYDAQGRVLRSALPGQDLADATTVYSYDETVVPHKRTARMKLADGTHATGVTYFDGAGREFQQRVTVSPGRFLVSGRQIHNAWGDVAEEFEPTFSNSLDFSLADAPAPSRRFFYDVLGRVTRCENYNGGVSTVAYEPFQVTTRDANDNDDSADNVARGQFDTPHREEFDVFRNVVRVSDQIDALTAETTTFTVGPQGELLRVADDRGVKLSYTYDNRGVRMTVDSREAGVRRIFYDARKKPVRTVDGDGHDIRAGWDDAGRLTGLTGDGAPLETYTYDTAAQHALGRLARVDYVGGAQVYEYDVAGRLVRRSYHYDGEPTAQTLSYEYDPLGRQTAVVHTDGRRFDRRLTANGWLAGITGVLNQVEYDARGLPSEIEFANGVRTTVEYTPGPGRISRQTTVSATLQTLEDVTYTYDKTETMLASDDVAPGGAGRRDYSYDPLYQLTRMTGLEDGVAVDRGYDYVAHRNLARFDEAASTLHYDDAAHPDRLTGVTADGHARFDVMHDSGGNLLALPGQQFEYNVKNELVRLHTDAGLVADYSYDHLGMRTSKRVDDGNGAVRVTHYVGDQAEIRDGVASRFVTIGGLRCAVLTGDQVLFVHDNPTGSSSFFTDSTGERVGELDYEPFGNEASRTGSVDFQTYSLHPVDPESGLVYMRRRYYCPAIGRFLTPDLMALYQPENFIHAPAGLHLYAFVANDPMNKTDEDGLSFWSFVGSVVGVVVGVVVALLIIAAVVATGGIAGVLLGIGLVLAASLTVTGISYIVASNVNPNSAFGQFMRGFMIGFNAGMNATIATALFGPVVGIALGVINFLATFEGVSRNSVYQGILGWTSWLMPMSWGATGLGLIFFAINLVAAGVKGNEGGAKIDKLAIDWKTGTIVMVGGWIRGPTAFDMGNFVFMNPNYVDGSTPDRTYDAILRHETGHTLAVAAFGTAFGIADLIGENVVGAGAGDYGEQIAESHANRPGRPTIPMWG